LELAFAGGAERAILCNDDIIFGEDDVLRLARCATQQSHCFMVTCGGYHLGYAQDAASHGYSCCAINPIAIEIVGYFDENLFPAYLEDCDYSYRAALAGLQEGYCPGTAVRHLGSATISRDPILRIENQLTHGLNFQYYRNKWGGINGQETFTRPFNSLAYHPYHISQQMRTDPYPGNGRGRTQETQHG
jgi:GT2 family glycosyltransferase